MRQGHILPSISMVDVAKVHYGVSGSYYLSELAMASLLCRIPHPSLVLCLSCSVNLFGRVMRAILSLQAVRCMHKERKEGRTDEGRSSEREGGVEDVREERGTWEAGGKWSFSKAQIHFVSSRVNEEGDSDIGNIAWSTLHLGRSGATAMLKTS